MRLTLQVLVSVTVLLCLAATLQQVVAVSSGFLGRIEDKALFETVNLLTHEHPIAARKAFEGFATKFVKNEKEREDLIEKMDDVLVQPLANDNGGCQLCQVRSASEVTVLIFLNHRLFAISFSNFLLILLFVAENWCDNAFLEQPMGIKLCSCPLGLLGSSIICL